MKKIRKRIQSCFRRFLYGKSGGFTFVETIAVLAIGAVMAAGSTVSAAKLIKTAKPQRQKNQVSQYQAALQSYFLDCGRFPTSEQGLEALWQKPELYPVPEEWNGPYLEKKPGKDPWGNAFEYVSAETSELGSEVPENLPFTVLSYGSDGQKGGEGDGRDIVSWE